MHDWWRGTWWTPRDLLMLEFGWFHGIFLSFNNFKDSIIFLRAVAHLICRCIANISRFLSIDAFNILGLLRSNRTRDQFLQGESCLLGTCSDFLFAGSIQVEFSSIRLLSQRYEIFKTRVDDSVLI